MSEQTRLQALYRYRVLDTPPEKDFDDITALAAHICEAPMALISLVDHDRQWFKSAIGIDVPQTERCIAFCDHAIRDSRVFIVRDAKVDDRFSENPLVLASPNLRFYAGAPLTTPTGEHIGTLCVLSGQPKVLSPAQIDALERLSRQVIRLLEARLSELESEESKRLDLAAINESIPQLVWQIAPNGEIMYLNQRWADYTGEKGMKTDWAKILHPDDISTVDRLWRASLTTGDAFECEYRLLRLDGVYRWFLARGIPQIDKSGKIIKWFGTSTDIQDQKEAEELQNTFFSLPNILLCLASPTGRFVRVNDAWKDVLGYTAAEMTAGPWLDFVHPEDRDITATETKSIEGGIPSTSFENRYRCKDGSYRWIQWTSIPRNGIFYCIAQDVTERKANEQERMQLRVREEAAIATSKLKSEFLANMSHEIRTPINGVVGMTGLLKDTRLSSQQKEFVDNIKRSSDALLSIINEILDFSKVEAGKMDLDSVDFDLHELLHDSVKTLKFAAESKSLHLRVDRCPIFETQFKGDPGRIRQVITNLMSNAIKFTHVGKVSVTLEVDEIDHKTKLIRCEVRDTGIGIPPTALDRMFQAFSQADSSTTRRFGGTGLGLSISKKLVELMGGDIGLESKAGVGSTFWFTVPLEVGSEINTAEVPEIQEFDPSFFAGRRVLVAEDNAINQFVVLKQLEKLGIKADAVADGNEAIDALRAVPYDLVLMDCQMPELDGYDATQLIRKSRTMPFTAIPVIALTANAIQGDRQKCLDSGMNDYLSKPVEMNDLINVLKRWLEGTAAA